MSHVYIPPLSDAELDRLLGLDQSGKLALVERCNAAHREHQERRRRGEVPNATLKPFRVEVQSSADTPTPSAG